MKYNESEYISLSVIKRLPKYYRCLGDLLDENVIKISSRELSEEMGLTSSQIRQDLNNFGCFGIQGYGYNVEKLYNEIKSILGLDKPKKIVIVGAGNVGRAISNYKGFVNRGFNFVAIFDKSKDIIGKKFGNLFVEDVKNLDEFLNNNKVDIVVLAVPTKVVVSIYDIITKHNIKGIWNFTQLDLNSTKKIKVENVNLADSIMTLSYKMSEDQIFKKYRR